MTLKTLLLGSAASLMAVTSSFAADAVVAEPEAVEYVRVCDAYGTGYFYIPGTERCMQLSGEVRFEYRINDFDNVVDGDRRDDVDADWLYRARFAIRTANESDFGTIRTYIRFETSGNDPDGFGIVAAGGAGELVAAGANRATFLQAMTLSIGGAEFGVFDNYWTKNNGYGNLFAMNDGYYGYDQAIYAQYTFEVAGFAVAAGVEQTLNDGTNSLIIPNYSGDDLNVYAGANYGGSWGNVAGTLYYDTFQEEIDYKVSLLLKPLEGLQVKGWYLGGEGTYTQQAAGADGDYAYGLSAAYTFGDVTPYVGYSDADRQDAVLVAGAVWSPSSTDGLQVQVEANFDLEDDNEVGEDNAYRLRLIKSF